MVELELENVDAESATENNGACKGLLARKITQFIPVEEHQNTFRSLSLFGVRITLLQT